jgi:hypothetical protein
LMIRYNLGCRSLRLSTLNRPAFLLGEVFLAHL